MIRARYSKTVNEKEETFYSKLLFRDVCDMERLRRHDGLWRRIKITEDVLVKHVSSTKLKFLNSQYSIVYYSTTEKKSVIYKKAPIQRNDHKLK